MLLSPAPQQDAELADRQVEQDGRDRLDRGLPCGLDRYYSVVPDLIAKPISLDAAIDISLRSIAAHGRMRDALQEKHAECLLKSLSGTRWADPPRCRLNNQLVSTSGMGATGPNRRWPPHFPCVSALRRGWQCPV